MLTFIASQGCQVESSIATARDATLHRLGGARQRRLHLKEVDLRLLFREARLAKRYARIAVESHLHLPGPAVRLVTTSIAAKTREMRQRRHRGNTL